MKSKISLLLPTIILLLLPTKINAQEACDQPGEACCLFGLEHRCASGTNLTCQREENPNNDPDQQYDDYIFMCRQDETTDFSTCDEVEESCCIDPNSGIPTCQGLSCVNGQCQGNNIDYSGCTENQSSCCFGAIAGCGLTGCNYCGPGLTKIETLTSCGCVSPGEEYEPSSTPPPFNLCEISGNNQACIDCYQDGTGGVWTGLGCIRFSPKDFIVDFLRIAIGIAGGLAFLLMIYGSFLVSTSAGDPKKSDEGKEIITGTIAGLLFIIFSALLLRLIGVDILRIPGL